MLSSSSESEASDDGDNGGVAPLKATPVVAKPRARSSSIALASAASNKRRASVALALAAASGAAVPPKSISQQPAAAAVRRASVVESVGDAIRIASQRQSVILSGSRLGSVRAVTPPRSLNASDYSNTESDESGDGDDGVTPLEATPVQTKLRARSSSIALASAASSQRRASAALALAAASGAAVPPAAAARARAASRSGDSVAAAIRRASLRPISVRLSVAPQVAVETAAGRPRAASRAAAAAAARRRSSTMERVAQSARPVSRRIATPLRASACWSMTFI